MKVAQLLEIEDQWTNKEETIEHLFKVQAARSIEFVRYFNRLVKENPKWPPVEMNNTRQSTIVR